MDKISQGHAKILVGLENAILLTEKIVKKKLSVRQAENLARLLKIARKFYRSKDSNIIATENELSEKLACVLF